MPQESWQQQALQKSGGIDIASGTRWGIGWFHDFLRSARSDTTARNMAQALKPKKIKAVSGCNPNL